MFHSLGYSSLEEVGLAVIGGTVIILQSSEGAVSFRNALPALPSSSASMTH